MGYCPLKGAGVHFFSVVLEKKYITNSYFISFFMFICQNVGNLKGFLLVYIHGLYLITLSSYSSTGEAPHHSKKNKIKYLSIQLLIRGTCRGATEGLDCTLRIPISDFIIFLEFFHKNPNNSTIKWEKENTSVQSVE